MYAESHSFAGLRPAFERVYLSPRKQQSGSGHENIACGAAFMPGLAGLWPEGPSIPARF